MTNAGFLVLFSKQAAKIGRGPSVCCRCVWNSNSMMQRCCDNGKQALPGEKDADMAAATRTHTRGPPQPLSRGLHRAWLRLPLLKGIKLKSNVASGSFFPPIPPIQAVKNGESRIKTLTATDMSVF